MREKRNYNTVLAAILIYFVSLFFGNQSSLYAVTSSTAFMPLNTLVASLTLKEEPGNDVLNQFVYKEDYSVASEEEIFEEEKLKGVIFSKTIFSFTNTTYLSLQKAHTKSFEFEKSKLMTSIPIYLQLEVFRL